ncbi:hypothetical protein [Nostoc sp.]|uniref:hypothetical protein n=1 Tax=Nostoc sp. TaxID=1180 RepID=UPI002FF95353
MPKSSFSGKSPQIFSKINVLEIVTNHLNTLRDYGASKHSKFDIFLFFILPFIIGVCVVFSGIVLNKDLISTLINVFAIFAGLLFNLLVLIYDVSSKAAKPTNSVQANKLKLEILEQIYFNISFEILLSLLIVILLSISIMLNNGLANSVFSVLVFFLAILFILTFLMVLKRVNILISQEIDQQKKSIP